MAEGCYRDGHSLAVRRIDALAAGRAGDERACKCAGVSASPICNRYRHELAIASARCTCFGPAWLHTCQRSSVDAATARRGRRSGHAARVLRSTRLHRRCRRSCTRCPHQCLKDHRCTTVTSGPTVARVQVDEGGGIAHSVADAQTLDPGRVFPLS